jgi:rhodanese-related sulfurtransferase
MSVINIDVEELKKMIREGNLEIIDIREPYEHEDYHIKGDKLIPMSMVPLKLEEINWSKKVVFYCQTGSRSGMLAHNIAGQGKEVYNLANGAYMWNAQGDDEFLEAGN